MNVLEYAQKIEGGRADAIAAARLRQENLVKPMGSLGSLEDISIQMAGITGNIHNQIDKKVHFLFGADNGVYDEGVAGSPQYFTNLLMSNYGAGTRCGINVICAHNHVDLKLVDVGIKGMLDYTNILNRRLMAEGTHNFLKEPAMSRETVMAALAVGFEFAGYASENGYQIIGNGEVGMANTTTAAACIMAALQLNDCQQLVGRGAGLTDEAFAKKKQVIQAGLRIHQPDPDDAVDILAKVGGLDIAAMTGLYVGAAYYRLPIVIDGVISIAAALLASKINFLTRDFMIPSHLSDEPAYKVAAKALQLKPFLNLDMRLGEGTGCPIAMGIVETALAVMNEMSTFAEMAMESDYRQDLSVDNGTDATL